MNNIFNGSDQVAQWRNGREQGNPAGPLFAAGQFAEAEIVSATPTITCGTACSGSWTRECC